MGHSGPYRRRGKIGRNKGMKAKYLIINADDYGMCHSSNAGTEHLLKEHKISSCTLMLPCPWALSGMKFLEENKDVEFGVHLTAISEHPYYKWGPIAPAGEVASLLADGRFFRNEDQLDDFIRRVKIEELEKEYRAQIESVYSRGLRPTHLDSHCNTHELRPDIFEMTNRLALEYNLPLRTAFPENITRQKSLRRFTVDYPVIDSFRIRTEEKDSFFTEYIRNIEPGITEIAIHPAMDSEELRAIKPDWDVRVADFKFFNSSSFFRLLEENSIVLASYHQTKHNLLK